MTQLKLQAHRGPGRTFRLLFSSPSLSSLTLGAVTFVMLLALVALFDTASLTARSIAVYLTAAVMVGGTTLMAYYPIRGLWLLARSSPNGQPLQLLRTIRRAWRVLLLVALNLACASLWRAGRSPWSSEVVSLLALTTGVWLIALITWPCLDTTLAKLTYVMLAGARHPSPVESARIMPLLARLAPPLGLVGIPWVLVRQHHAFDEGQAFASVVALDRSAIADWPDDALTGLVAHELAHISLDHSRLSASVLACGLSFWFAITSLYSWLPTVLSPATPAVLALPMVIVVPVGWMALQCLVFFFALSRSNYPCEAEADALVIDRGYAREFEAALLMRAAAEHAEHKGFWAWLLRTHPSHAERLNRARTALTVEDASQR